MSWWHRPKKELGPGLYVKFKVGEKMPWKGIWFQISKVEHAKIEIEPLNTTAQFQKKIKGG